jgi:hypothetical protein
VTLPVGQAMGRVKKVLFQSLDVGRWFVLGFGARLACLGEGGGSSALRLSHLIHSIRRPHAQPRRDANRREFLLSQTQRGVCSSRGQRAHVGDHALA